MQPFEPFLGLAQVAGILDGVEAEIIRRALDAYLAWDDPDYIPYPNQPERKANLSPS